MASEPLSTITINDLDPAVANALSARASQNGRSMEAEVRAIIEAAIEPKAKEIDFATFVRSFFEPLGGLQLELPPREPMRDPPDFSKHLTGMDDQP